MPSTPPRCWRRSSGSSPVTTSVRASVLAIADELTEDGFVLRYRTDETDDGLSGKEGTFLICSFWLVSALSIVGELQRGPRPVRAAAAGRLTARAVRRGVRRRHRVPPRQLPPGLLPPRPDRGRRSDHHRRAPPQLLTNGQRWPTCGRGGAEASERRVHRHRTALAARRHPGVVHRRYHRARIAQPERIARPPLAQPALEIAPRLDRRPPRPHRRPAPDGCARRPHAHLQLSCGVHRRR